MSPTQVGSTCASCGAAMAASDAACPSCGQPRAQSRPRAASGSDDALQYVKIIGIIVVVVVIVVILAGMMGPGSQPCGECRGKKTISCPNCVSGRTLCNGCNGRGYDPQTFSTCSKCGGKGDLPACWKCGGKPTKNCPTCKGTGIHPE